MVVDPAEVNAMVAFGFTVMVTLPVAAQVVVVILTGLGLAAPKLVLVLV